MSEIQFHHKDTKDTKKKPVCARFSAPSVFSAVKFFLFQPISIQYPRRTGFTASLYEPVSEDGGKSRQYSLGGMYGLNVNKQIPELGVEGFGTKEAVYNELAIAPFVTDVVEVSGETLHIYSVLPESFGIWSTWQRVL